MLRGTGCIASFKSKRPSAHIREIFGRYNLCLSCECSLSNECSLPYDRSLPYECSLSCSALAFDKADAMIPGGMAMTPNPIIRSKNVNILPPPVTG